MAFYEEFIEKYDKLISWGDRFKREAEFFKKIFLDNNVKTILDCACGTGQHVIMFTQMGFKTKGSDLSPAMIRKAKVNSKKYGIKTTLKITDFRNLTKSFNEKFDAVVCIGNSLPHLLSDKDLIKALNEIYKVLNKNGILILQQRNYDMLIESQKRFFPVSIREDEIFFYVLDYFPNKIIFNVVNLELKSKKFKVYKTEYNPLQKIKLARLLRKSGFNNLKFYGNFNFAKFSTRKDDYLIIVCRK
jgi:ubiquinone/menaquinone biosynthesis C-methylase UbiE